MDILLLAIILGGILLGCWYCTEVEVRRRVADATIEELKEELREIKENGEQSDFHFDGCDDEFDDFDGDLDDAEFDVDAAVDAALGPCSIKVETTRMCPGTAPIPVHVKIQPLLDVGKSSKDRGGTFPLILIAIGVVIILVCALL